MSTTLQPARLRNGQRIPPEHLKAALSTIANNARIAVDACEEMGSDDAHIVQSLLLRIGVTADDLLSGLGASPVRGDPRAWMIGGEA